MEKLTCMRIFVARSTIVTSKKSKEGSRTTPGA
jgi:hypothetical protein